MRPLTPFRRPPPRRGDPAPSRLAYRMQRLALTPSVRRAFTLGVPAFALAVIGGLTFASPDRRAGLAAWAGEVQEAIRSREEFMVHDVAIAGGSEALRETVAGRLALDPPASSFDLDLGALRDRVMDLDAVDRAELRVRPGGVLDVEVEARVPRLLWRTAGGLTALDGTGQRVGPVAERSARSDLPLVSGRGADRAAEEALRLVAAAAPLEARLRGLVRIGERRWDLILSDRQKIKLPESGAEAALRRVLEVDAEQDLFARDVVLVDMRLPRRPTVRLHPDAARDLRQVKLSQLGDD